MAQHVVKILDAHFVTHNVKRFVIEKPTGYAFIPGQGTDVAINLPDWKDKTRPFTFTGLNGWEHLELIVKIYRGHDGVTEQLGKLNEGAELILHDVFGTITYKSPGVFIAGGTGITPFIAIFRDLYKRKKIFGNKLIYSERTSQDIILGEELLTMLGDNFVPTFTRENVIGFLDKHIDRNFLIENISDFGQDFYVCGPESFVKNVTDLLLELGASPEALVIEK